MQGLAEWTLSGTAPAGFEAHSAANWLSELLGGFTQLPDLLNRLPIGLHIEDRDLRSIFINDGFGKIFGYALEEIATPELWWPLAYPDPVYRAAVQSRWFAAVAEAQAAGTEISPQEWRVTCRDGTEKVVQFHCRWIGDYHVHAYVDVTARHRLEAELRTLANTDALTGIANRRRFFEAAGEILERDGALAVLLFDLDHFKSVNDTYGHVVGDAVLREVATRCSDALGDAGLLGRLGGEEFAALLPACGRSRAEAIAERLRIAVCGTPILGTPYELIVTISLGGTLRFDGETELDGLLARADRLLYAAKREGRNRLRFDHRSSGG